MTKGVALIFEIPYLCLWLFDVKKRDIDLLPSVPSHLTMEWKGRCSRRFLKVKAPVLRPLYYLLHAPFKRTWTIFKEELHKAVVDTFPGLRNYGREQSFAAGKGGCIRT